jgi:predicted solute-binding protein
MTRRFDFALVSHLRDTAKTYYQWQVERVQQFSIDSGIPFNQVLDMPMHFLDDYYNKGAWNIQKAHKENHDQMQKNLFQLMQNIFVQLRNMR